MKKRPTICGTCMERSDTTGLSPLVSRTTLGPIYFVVENSEIPICAISSVSKGEMFSNTQKKTCVGLAKELKLAKKNGSKLKGTKENKC